MIHTIISLRLCVCVCVFTVADPTWLRILESRMDHVDFEIDETLQNKERADDEMTKLTTDLLPKLKYEVSVLCLSTLVLLV